VKGNAGKAGGRVEGVRGAGSKVEAQVEEGKRGGAGG